jgi:hypothetical protein
MSSTLLPAKGSAPAADASDLAVSPSVCEVIHDQGSDAKTKRSWRTLDWSVAEQVTAVAAGRYTRAVNARVFRAREGAA